MEEYRNSPEVDKAAFLKVGTPAMWLYWLERGVSDPPWVREIFGKPLRYCPVCAAFPSILDFLFAVGNCSKCRNGVAVSCLEIKPLSARFAKLRRRLERAGMFKPEPSAWVDGV